MTENVIDVMQTTVDIPPKEQRAGYQIPFIKPTEGNPLGGNFSLDKLLNAEATQEELDALQKQITDNKTAQDAKNEAQDNEIALKADKAIEKGLFLDVDNPIFRVDGDGVPFPQNQKATIKAKKKYIEEPIHWDVHGKTIPDGTEQVEVDVNELVSEGIVLKNFTTENNDAWTAPSNSKAYNITKRDGIAKWYIRGICKYTTEDNPSRLGFILNGGEKVIAVDAPKINQEYIVSGIRPIALREFGSVTTWTNTGNSGVSNKELICIDITALSEKYPQYSDEQLKAILDESLPYISAQQSVNLGGVCELENSVPNPYSTDGWNAQADVRDFSISNGTVKGTIDKPLGYNSKTLIIKLVKRFLLPNNKYFYTIKNISATNGFNIGLGYMRGNSNKYYDYPNLNRETNIISVGGALKGDTTVSFVPSDGIICIDTTSSLLDLWLSLNGYSTDEQKADWCNEHIPPFEGTYDLVLSINQELPVVATCGNYSASTRIEVVENLNSLINLHTHLGKIEMDGKATSDKLVTLDQEVVRQGGAIVTETNARLDAYTYTRRSIPTSELAQLKEAIASGNPEKFGFHEGDYFSVNGYTYVLADYDHWFGGYDSYGVINKRHWGVLVNTGATHAWNSNGSTNGGYAGSELHAYLVDTVLPKIEADLTPLGLSLIANQRLYSTAMNPSGYNRYGSASGCASSWGWSANQKISAPTEIEIYGSTAWSSSGYDTGEGCKPLKACQRFRYNELLPWKYFWLRDIATASYACFADYGGFANRYAVTSAISVVGLIGIY